jgi:hypothetical protein
VYALQPALFFTVTVPPEFETAPAWTAALQMFESVVYTPAPHTEPAAEPAFAGQVQLVKSEF